MSTASGANAQAAGRSGSQESTSNAQAAASGSQGNNQISDPQQATPQHSPAEEETVSLEHAKKIRQENASLRDRIAQIEDAQKQAELAQLSEHEKLQKSYADLQEKYASLEVERQNWRLADAIARHAPALGLIDPDAARLMLLNGGELEQDKDGDYTNVEKLLEKLVVAKPYLVAANNAPRANFPTSGGATNPGRSAAPAAQQPAAPSAKDMYKRHREGGGLGNSNLWKRNP